MPRTKELAYELYARWVGAGGLGWAGSGLGWPDRAWAGACRPAWVASGPRAWVRRAPGGALGSRLELAGVAADQRRERKEERKERKKEKEKEKRRSVRERRRREEKRKKKKFLECSGFSKLKTRLYSVRIFVKHEKLPIYPF